MDMNAADRRRSDALSRVVTCALVDGLVHPEEVRLMARTETLELVASRVAVRRRARSGPARTRVTPPPMARLTGRRERGSAAIVGASLMTMAQTLRATAQWDGWSGLVASS